MPTASPNRNVFINCPFDEDYLPFFHATVFAVTSCGFVARCALESDDSTENRLNKILGIIQQCSLGIHDISRTQPDREHALPRFNMPFELGLFMGLGRTKGTGWKTGLILDTESYRYQKFLSDISGQDIHAHSNDPVQLVRIVRNWLGHQPHDREFPSAREIEKDYWDFEDYLAHVLEELRIRHPASELPFFDLMGIVGESIGLKRAGAKQRKALNEAMQSRKRRQR